MPRNKKNIKNQLKPVLSALETEHPELFEEHVRNSPKKELQLKSVSKTIKGVTILSTINLEFVEGEIFTILGETNSGKSTLFSLCTGISSRT